MIDIKRLRALAAQGPFSTDLYPAAIWDEVILGSDQCKIGLNEVAEALNALPDLLAIAEAFQPGSLADIEYILEQWKKGNFVMAEEGSPMMEMMTRMAKAAQVMEGNP